METLKELTGSIREYLRERTTNPFYGAFIVAWLGVNFRLVLVLFGDGEARSKIEYIDRQLYPATSDWAWFGLGLPALAATVFVLISPFIRRWVSVFIREHDKATLEKLLKVEGETPLTNEKADALRRSLQAERERRIRDRESANQQIDELQRQLELAAVENLERRTGTAASGSSDVGDTSSSRADVFPVREDDFVGVPQKVYITVAQRGLTRAQSQMLYELRNGKAYSLARLADLLGHPEHHPVKVLVDQLKGMGLIELIPVGSEIGYRITSAGSQALDAVMKRGFTAAASPAPQA